MNYDELGDLREADWARSIARRPGAPPGPPPAARPDAGRRGAEPPRGAGPGGAPRPPDREPSRGRDARRGRGAARPRRPPRRGGLRARHESPAADARSSSTRSGLPGAGGSRAPRWSRRSAGRTPSRRSPRSSPRRSPARAPRCGTDVRPLTRDRRGDAASTSASWPRRTGSTSRDGRPCGPPASGAVDERLDAPGAGGTGPESRSEQQRVEEAAADLRRFGYRGSREQEADRRELLRPRAEGPARPRGGPRRPARGPRQGGGPALRGRGRTRSACASSRRWSGRPSAPSGSRGAAVDYLS